MVAGGLSLLALAGAACSSTPSATGTPTAGAPATAAPVAAATTPAGVASASPTPAATAGGVTGSWTGTYSGAYSGTFSLAWTQTGTNLNGTIKLSSPPSTLSITGTLQGSAITFGAVGGVSYTGSVSGNSMSGTYVVPPGTSSSGNWSASRS